MYTGANNYRGWEIRHDPYRPLSGQWWARQHGVTINHNNEAGLRNMIDFKVNEANERRNQHDPTR